MQIYALMNRVGWPSSYVGKIFALCFIGTHAPLIALVLWAVVWTDVAVPMPVLVVVLLGTLAGTAFTFAAIAAMLAPVRRSREALLSYSSARQLPDLPTDYGDDAGQLMMSVQQTIGRLDAKMSELSRMAHTDELTGARNRRWMNDVGIPRFERERLERRHFTLLVIDLDEFKQINDQWGHSIGDQALLLVSDAIRATLREGDIVVRMGGDEFFAVLPSVDGVRAFEIAERICAQVKQASTALPIDRNITISIGASASRDTDQGFIDVYRRSDRHLYHVKRTGRGRVAASEQG